MKKYLLMLIIIVSPLSFTSTAGADPWSEPLEKIYWGDLHVHTNYSMDAFVLGMSPGRYVDEAGLYALYCSRLDFYSVTDHANMIMDTNYWKENIRAANYFNQIGRENPDENGDPSIVAFPGWEWTIDNFYGHKNIILKYDDPAKLPPYPIRCRPGIQGSAGVYRGTDFDFETEERPFAQGVVLFLGIIFGYMNGDNDLTYVAPTSGDLFGMIRTYCTDAGTGCEALVIPHGNAWGIVPKRFTDWERQLDPINHDQDLQKIIEVYSKHGNSEEYSYFPPMWRYFKNDQEVPAEECLKEVKDIWQDAAERVSGTPYSKEMLPECTRTCPEPTEAYVPCCWRAGDIVAKRCLDPESDFCRKQIELARAEVQPFPNPLSESELNQLKTEYRTNPDKAGATDWGACGQCLDCWQPAAHYRNNGSVQKALASAYFDETGNPLHYKFGFIASTDAHSSWSGSVKETKGTTEANMNPDQDERPALEYPAPERVDNFLNPGGLAAILANHRTRDDLWDSLQNRNVYSTSGARIEVWARAEVNGQVVKMGSESTANTNPTFSIKANGAFVEDDTCPYDDEPIILANFTKSEFARVCRSQCYRITDERTPIARIEVVKVLQPLTPAEVEMENLERSTENPDGLIMDPYNSEDVNGEQIEWSWTDDTFVNEPSGRSVAYYFRIIQSQTPGYNCRPIALLESGISCDLMEPNPVTVEAMINPQDGSTPKPLSEIEDPCYADQPDSSCEERAWTSPFYITRE